MFAFGRLLIVLLNKFSKIYPKPFQTLRTMSGPNIQVIQSSEPTFLSSMAVPIVVL